MFNSSSIMRAVPGSSLAQVDTGVQVWKDLIFLVSLIYGGWCPDVINILNMGSLLIVVLLVTVCANATLLHWHSMGIISSSCIRM